MDLNGSKAVVADVNANTPANYEPKPFSSMDMDGMVPDILRKAVEKTPEPAPVKPQVTPAPQAKPPVPDVTPQQVKPPVPSADDDEPDDEGDSGNTTASDIDVSPEAVDRLISSEDGVAVPLVKKDDTVPPWQDTDKFKTFSKRLKNLGVKQEDLISLVSEISDGRVVESAEFVKSLTEERDALKTRAEHNDLEISRLRSLEKFAHFDNSKEVQDKYIVPMASSSQEIEKVLTVAGSGVPVGHILQANTRPEIMELVKGTAFEDKEVSAIMNHWRNYKDLELKLQADRTDAKQNLAKHLSTEIPQEVGKKIFDSTFIKALQEDGFKYLNSAIMDGLEKNPEMQEIVTAMNTNFMNLLRIIGNPVEHSKNPDFLGKLARFSINNADAQYHRKRYFGAVKDLEAKDAALKKLMTAYSELKASARGINGTPGSLSVPRTAQNGSSANGHEPEKVAEELQKLLEKKTTIEDFLSL